MSFKPTHIFVLNDDTEVPVTVEERGDFVAFEENGTPWYTVMGPLSKWWSCRARNLTSIKEVRVQFGPSEALQRLEAVKATLGPRKAKTLSQAYEKARETQSIVDAVRAALKSVKQDLI